MSKKWPEPLYAAFHERWTASVGTEGYDKKAWQALERLIDELVPYETNVSTGRYKVGDRVLKHTGDYAMPGEVRAVCTTKAGKVRFVVEHDADRGSFLHIYAEANLKREE
jgi:hypothetical protein